MFILVDDYTRITLTRPLKRRAEISGATSELINILERNFNCKVAIVHEESAVGNSTTDDNNANIYHPLDYSIESL